MGLASYVSISTNNQESKENGMTAGDMSDLIAAEALRYFQLTPGPFRLWLLYDKDSGEGVSYIEGFYDPIPTLAATRPTLGVVRVPEELWDVLRFEVGPMGLRCIGGTIVLK
jgi:hypothetical protein